MDFTILLEQCFIQNQSLLASPAGSVHTRTLRVFRCPSERLCTLGLAVQEAFSNAVYKSELYFPDRQIKHAEEKNQIMLGFKGI